MAGASTSMWTRRRLLGAAGLSAAGLAGGLSGCSQGAGELGDGTGEITVWTWPDNDKVFLETIPAFRRAHPEIEVKVQGFGGTSYNPKLLGALVSRTGPDVAMVEITYVSNFKAKPGFVDLSQPPFRADRFAKKYADFSWSYATEKNGRVFTLPKNTGPGGMFYRRDVFERHGLPTEPAEVHELMRTWDDYIKVGRKLVKDGEQWLVDQPSSVVDAVRGQMEVSYFDEDGAPTLTSPEMHAALEMIPRLRSAGVLAPNLGDQERGAAINRGSIATFFSGNWFGGWLKHTYASKAAGKWGVALAPETNGVSAFNAGGDFIGVLASSKRQLAAWRFVRWVTQHDASLSAMYTKDLYPAWLPALESDWINRPDPYYANQNVNEVFSEVSRTMPRPVTNPNDAIAVTALRTAITDVQNGARTVRAALARAQAEVEAKMV